MKIQPNTTLIKAHNRIITFLFAFLCVSVGAFSQEHATSEAEKGFKPGDMIMHHIADQHQIHIIGQVHIPLPVILYNHGHLDIFSSSQFWNGYDSHGELQFKPYTASSGTTYENHHETIVISSGEHAAADHASHEMHTMANDTMHSDTAHMHMAAQPMHAAEPTVAVEHAKPMDFSITKSVFGMLLIMVILCIVFLSVAKAYAKRKGEAPKGLQNLMEPLILFIRDEVAVPSLGKKKAGRYLPFLLTVFFFIWMCNMLGLIPFLGGFNITGTLSITLVLATIVFLMTTFSGNAHYWGHIFWPPGVPLPIKIILVPIEIMSIFIKPAVLMIRLTANITAGHIIILAFVSLILLFGQNSAVAGYSVGIGSVLFMIFMFFIELLVAFLQAYVFTLLAALYFGDATQEHHHEEAHH
jgi:F-type H+-transporting ATPase subunit a